MGEDCLTVNVVAPATDHRDPLPVMLFVHGGGYILGSSATPLYEGASLARRGCVYVSVNYRLGVLGCLDFSSLSTRTHLIDNNLFLRDLVLALQWVSHNVSAFGGDPGNVTIFGESSGAHAIATLLAVPAARGLFTRAICQSPPSGMVRSPEAAADFTDQFVGLLDIERQDAAAALKTVHPLHLVGAFDRWIATAVAETPGSFAVGATVDGDFLPRDPLEAMADGTAHPVPLIVGSNAEEGRLFARFMKVLPMSETHIERLLEDIEPAARELLTAAYPGYPGRNARVQLAGDMCFASASWQIAEAHSRHAPTYAYRYDYAPRTLAWSGLGATHATELFALFDAYRTRFGSLLTMATDRRSALRISDDLQRRWLAFSRSGAPGGDWPAYGRAHRAVMILDHRSRVEIDPTPARRQFWHGLRLLR